jgi:ribonuclease P protein component
MLPEVNRLRTDADFKKVFDGGRTAENQFLRIKFRKNGKNATRFGFIVGTKFAKKAVLRNRVKRRLRAAVLALLKKVNPGFDIVVWPKPKSAAANYRDAADGLKDLFYKNDLLSL